MAPSSDFYSTAAQVIPTLLLVVAVEGRVMQRLQPRPFTLVCFLLAFCGEIAAVHALYVGGSDLRAFITFLGVMFAVWAALLPLPLLLIPENHPHRGRMLTLVGLAIVFAIALGTFL